jgi:hypothetical protein
MYYHSTILADKDDNGAWAYNKHTAVSTAQTMDRCLGLHVT